MNLQHVHSGGYFTLVDRAEREAKLRQAATAAGRLLIIERTEAAAAELGGRLALAGMPVIVGLSDDAGEAARLFVRERVRTLVVAEEYVLEHGPLPAPLVMHARMATSSRTYARRIESAIAPVHVTLVVPEEESSASSLVVQLSDEAVLDLRGDLQLADVLQTSVGAAIVREPRRRFPLMR